MIGICGVDVGEQWLLAGVIRRHPGEICRANLFLRTSAISLYPEFPGNPINGTSMAKTGASPHCSPARGVRFVAGDN